jgi:hypothetical protein
LSSGPRGGRAAIITAVAWVGTGMLTVKLLSHIISIPSPALILLR